MSFWTQLIFEHFCQLLPGEVLVEVALAVGGDAPEELDLLPIRRVSVAHRREPRVKTPHNFCVLQVLDQKLLGFVFWDL